MVKKLVVVLAFALVASVPLSAEVKYTMHMEARTAAGAGTDPMSQMAGGMLTQIFPAGGVDQVVISGDKGMRSEQKQGFANIKAGMVTIVKPDGAILMLDPSTKTYWKQPAISEQAMSAMAGVTPDIKLVKKGEFETINGMKAEHLRFQMTMAIPGVDASQLPPGMAPDLTMTYDVWLTDAIKSAAGSASLSTTVLKQFGMGGMKEMNDGRMMLKGVMAMFGVEIVTTTSGFTNEPAPATLFDAPADYKEVPSPIK